MEVEDLENRVQILQWLNSLSKVEKSIPFWMSDNNNILQQQQDMNDSLSSSSRPAEMIQSMLDSFHIMKNPITLFNTVDASSKFDKIFYEQFVGALPITTNGATTDTDEVLSSGKSNAHPLKIQLLACPPNFRFKLHSHPNIELSIPLVGELCEVRLMNGGVDPMLLCRPNRNEKENDVVVGSSSSPSEEELMQVKKSLQELMSTTPLVLDDSSNEGSSKKKELRFVDRTLNEGEVLYNEIGSVHQSYTKNEESGGVGCLLLVLWSGLHADIEDCTCCFGIEGSENLFLP